MVSKSIRKFLTDPGIPVAIALGVGIALYIIWGIICYFVKRSLIASNIQSRQLARKATLTTKRAGSAALSAGTNLMRVSTTEESKNENDEESGQTSNILSGDIDNGELTEDEKNNIIARASTIVGVIRTVGNCAIYLIVLISIMDAFGAPTNSLLTVAALSGFAIALAVSSSITDFVGGLFILIEGSYNIGDIITVCGIFGTIERMTLRVTYVRGLDGMLCVILVMLCFKKRIISYLIKQHSNHYFVCFRTSARALF